MKTIGVAHCKAEDTNQDVRTCLDSVRLSLAKEIRNPECRVSSTNQLIQYIHGEGCPAALIGFVVPIVKK